jgi:hypothetical protein
MPIKSYTLIPYHLTNHNIQSWRKNNFALAKGGIAVFWDPKKPLSQVDMKHALVPPLRVEILIFEKTIKSQFLVEFWADLDKICCIGNG